MQHGTDFSMNLKMFLREAQREKKIVERTFVVVYV